LGAYLGGINNVSERAIKIKPLSNQFAEKLLCEKAGKSIPKEDRSKLQKRDTEKVHGGFKSAYQHLFESLLGGHPIAISLAGNILANSSLNELYDTLVKSNLLNSLTQSQVGRSNVNSNLTTSLNLTLRLYKDK
jgi:hypothetical protein